MLPLYASLATCMPGAVKTAKNALLFHNKLPPLLSCVRNCPSTCTAHMSAGSTAHLSRPCEYHDQISGCSPCRMNEKSLRSQIWNGHASVCALGRDWRKLRNWSRLIKCYEHLWAMIHNIYIYIHIDRYRKWYQFQSKINPRVIHLHLHLKGWKAPAHRLRSSICRKLSRKST